MVRRPWRPTASVTMLITLTAVLAGCFTSAADFGADAEKYIRENDGLRQSLFPDADTTFVTVACADPPKREVGTTFACSATDSTGAVWEFSAVITGKTAYEVNLSRRPDGA